MTDTTEFGKILADQLKKSILEQGGAEEDLLHVENLVEEIAAKVVLQGINLRSSRIIYRLKPVNRLGEVSPFFHTPLLWNRPDILARQYPLEEIKEDAYCEVLKINVGDYDSMLKQITDMERVPAEINFFLSFVREKLVEDEVKEHITTIHPSNSFDDTREHSFEISRASGSGRNTEPTIGFFKKGEVEKFFQTINVLVRRKNFLKL